ncbi:hypothetical protein RB195_016204 [Necator americanus]|uniref:Uncharacterized protein n=1 Tax=Necator americanus TaxID=51031 RepID=A0ABR1EAM6_NECAM
MRLGFLLALLLIITAVSVEAGLGKKLKKGLKKIGKPFEKGAKKGAEIAAAGVAGKAIVSAAGAIGRRKRYDHEEYVGMYRKLRTN